MTNNAASHTYLECLFLFQLISKLGPVDGLFDRISEQIRANGFVQEDRTFDPARLTPQALQRLAMQTLKDAVTREDGEDGADGAVSPDSQKTKLDSSPPQLPSFHPTMQQVEKLPDLVQHFYKLYKEQMIASIREDERKYVIVQADIKVLEKAVAEKEAKAAAQNGSPSLAPRETKGVASRATAHVPPSTSAPAVTANTKRGPISNTPVYPPKVPMASIPSATASSRSPSGVSPLSARGGLSARPAKSATPSSQTSTAAAKNLQQPVQPARPALVPVPEVASTRGQADAAPSPASPSGAALKWEKPYQPPPTAQSLPKGPPQVKTQQGVAVTQNIQPQSSRPQMPLQPKHQPQAVPVQPRTTASSTPLQPSAQTITSQQSAAPQTTSTPSTAPPTTMTPISPPIPPSRPSQPPPKSQSAAKQQASRSTTNGNKRTPANITVPSPVAQKQLPLEQWRRTAAPVSPGQAYSQKARPNSSSFAAQPHGPSVPEHIIRQAAGTPGARRPGPMTLPPQPGFPGAAALTRGFGTKWASHSTPSTPGPVVVEPESPAYEPVSPPPQTASVAPPQTPKNGTRKSNTQATPLGESLGRRPRGRPPRHPRQNVTPAVSGSRRSLSAISQTDELSLDQTALSSKIKSEAVTPRPQEDVGDTTADESTHGRTQASLATPGSLLNRRGKRKRQGPLLTPTATLPNQVLWTRGFTKVSSSALDQISSHRDANLFATGVRERDAPNYRQVVLQPQDITSVRAAIKHGNKAAVQAAASLPGGDPGTASVWLPPSEDLVPPKGIVNSAQLERELVHMFCNAIMYNPDPDRGLGPAFIRRSANEEEEVVGYQFDENGVVRNTRGMFREVEKLLTDLRSAEKERGVPPLTATRQGSVATPVEDVAEDEDELAGDGNAPASPMKRRRVSTRA